MTAPIPVVVAGALGRMGAEVIKAVVGAQDCSLAGAIDNTPGKEGADVGLELGLGLGLRPTLRPGPKPRPSPEA